MAIVYPRDLSGFIPGTGAAVDALEDRVTDLETDVGVLEGAQAALSGVVSTHTGTLSTHTSQIGTLNGQNATQDAAIALNTGFRTSFGMPFVWDIFLPRNTGQPLVIFQSDGSPGLPPNGDLFVSNVQIQFYWQPFVRISSDGSVPGTSAEFAEVQGDMLIFDGAEQKYVIRNISLADLAGVDLTGLATNDVLQWDGTAWVPSALPGGSTTLAALTDVALTTPSAGQLLQFDGSDWVNATVATTSSIAGATDAAITAPSAGQLLRFNAGTAKWENFTQTLFSPTITSPATKNVLRYNGAAWVNAMLNTTDLSDWSTTAPTNGQIPIYNSGTGKYEPLSYTTSIGAASDALIASPATGQVLTYNATLSRWENQTPAGGGSTTLAGLTDIAVSGLVSGQLLRYSSGIGKWINSTVVYQTNNLSDWSLTAPTSGQIPAYSSVTSKYEPSSRLSTAEANITAIQQSFSQAQPPISTEADYDASETWSMTYGPSAPSGSTINTVATDAAYPFLVVDNSSPYIVPASAVSVFLMAGTYDATGGGYPVGNGASWYPGRLPASAGTRINYLPGAGLPTKRWNCDLGSNVTLSSGADALELNLSEGGGYIGASIKRWQVHGSNSPSFMLETSLTPTGTLIFDSGNYGATWNGTKNGTAASVGPFRYMSFIFTAFAGSGDMCYTYFLARSAAGGLTGLSLANSDFTMTRSQTTGLPTLTKAAGGASNQNCIVNLQRLAAYETFNRLMPTVVSPGVVRIGGTRVSAGLDAREVKIEFDTGAAFFVRHSAQGGGNRIILRPASNPTTGTSDGPCISLSNNPGTDWFSVFKNTAGSGTPGDVLMALDSSGNLACAGTVTGSTFLGQLNPFT